MPRKKSGHAGQVAPPGGRDAVDPVAVVVLRAELLEVGAVRVVAGEAADDPVWTVRRRLPYWKEANDTYCGMYILKVQTILWRSGGDTKTPLRKVLADSEAAFVADIKRLSHR